MSLPVSTHIGRAVLQVASVERSLGFYRDVIGFRKIERGDVAGAPCVTLGVDGDHRVWLELREHTDARRVPRGGLLGLYHFAVLLPSRAQLGRFLVHAMHAGATVASSNHLVSEALYLTDPDGITVEVYRDLPREAWHDAAGEIGMATLPLDVDAVVSAADEAPAWRGLPVGTSIGHMHFYVGDLTNADAFYHGCLGFDRTMTSYPGALFVSAGGYHHHVGLNTWASHTRAATDADARLVRWELIVPDATEIAEIGTRLRAAGYRVGSIDTGIESADAWGIVVRVLSS